MSWKQTQTQTYGLNTPNRRRGACCCCTSDIPPARRRCWVGSAGSYPSFSKGCGMFHGGGQRAAGGRLSPSVLEGLSPSVRGGSVQGGSRAAAGGTSPRCSSPANARIGGRDASPGPLGIEMGDARSRHLAPGILRVGKFGRRLSKR